MLGYSGLTALGGPTGCRENETVGSTGCRENETGGASTGRTA